MQDVLVLGIEPRTLSMVGVLVRVTIAMVKHRDRKQVEDKEFMWLMIRHL